jgi:two-component SAPR family response regulator
MATLNGYLRLHRPVITIKRDEFPLEISHVTVKTKAESIFGLLKKHRSNTEQSLFIFIDDVQYAKKDDLEFITLLTVLAEENTLPIHWIFSYRTVGSKSVPKSITALLAFHSSIHLSSFNSLESSTLITTCLGSDFVIKHEEFCSSLHNSTGGNPFFLQESIACLQQTGILHQVDGYWVTTTKADIQLPTTLTKSIDARCKRVLKNRKNALILGFIAISESPLKTQELAALTEIEKKYFASCKRLLRKENILADKLSFSHPLIRDRVINLLPKVVKQIVYSALYRYLSAHKELPAFTCAPYALHIEPTTIAERKEIIQLLRKAVNELFGKSTRLNELSHWIYRCYQLENNAEKKAVDLSKYAYLLQMSGDTDTSSPIYEHLLKNSSPEVYILAATDFIPHLVGQNQYNRAKNILNKAIRYAEERKDTHSLLRLYALKYVNRRGMGLKNSGDRLHQKIASIPRRNTQGRLLWCRHSLERANDYFLTNKISEAETLILDAITNAEKSQDHYICYLAYEKLQFAKLMAGDCFTALTYCEKSHAAALAYGHPHFIAMSQSYMSQALTFCSRFEEAVKYAESAVKTLMRLEKHISVQTPIAHLAGALQNLGQYLSAAEFIHSHEKLIVKHKTKNTHSILFMIMGSCYWSAGIYTLGEKLIRKGLSIARKDHLPGYEGQGYGFLGDAWMLKGKAGYSKACASFIKAHKILFHQQEMGILGARNTLKIVHTLDVGSKEFNEWFGTFELQREGTDYNLELEAASLYFQAPEVGDWDNLLEKALIQEDAMGIGLVQGYRAGYILKTTQTFTPEAEGALLPLILSSLRKKNIDVLIKFLSRFNFPSFSANWNDNPLIQLEVVLSLANYIKEKKTLSVSNLTGFRSRLTHVANSVLSGDYSPLGDGLPKENLENLFSKAVNRLTEYLNFNPNTPMGLYILAQFKENQIDLQWLKSLIKQQNSVTITSFGVLSISCNHIPPLHENWILQSRRLLAYLLTRKLHNHRPVSKWTIIEDLWDADKPEVLDKRLRQTLYRLRHLFPKEMQVQIIQSDPESHTYDIIDASNLWWDAGEFVNAYKKGRQFLQDGEAFKAMLEFERGQPLYTGKYLQGMDELWSHNVSQELERYYYYMIDCLCEYHFNNKSPEMVHFYADHIRNNDPLEECGIFWQVKAWLLQRKKAVAFRNFNEWTEIYKNELEFPPDLTFEEITTHQSFRAFWKGKLC